MKSLRKFRITIICLIPLWPGIAGAQKWVDVTSVYFDTDQYELRLSDQNALSVYIDSISDHAYIRYVDLYGNTDNTSDSAYNRTLSVNRCRAVATYLETKNVAPDRIKLTGYGEERPIAPNAHDSGKQINRRVDILFKLEYKGTVTEPVVPAEPEKHDTCISGDTTIALKSGAFVVFDRCEYAGYADCLEIEQINDRQSLLQEDITLMQDNGQALASCGMINLRFNDSCGRPPCFKVPVRVLLPVGDKSCDICGRNAGLFNLNSERTWSQSTRSGPGIRLVRLDGKDYYEFFITCANTMKNCDCAVLTRKIKFKSPPKTTIAKVKVVNDCPLTMMEFKPAKKKNFYRKNICKGKFPCVNGNPNVIITLVDAEGDTLHMPLQPLNNLRHKVMFSKCKNYKMPKTERVMGIFSARPRYIYRKYVIR